MELFDEVEAYCYEWISDEINVLSLYEELKHCWMNIDEVKIAILNESSFPWWFDETSSVASGIIDDFLEPRAQELQAIFAKHMT